MYPSYGMYPDKEIFEDEHFTDNEVTVHGNHSVVAISIIMVFTVVDAPPQ